MFSLCIATINRYDDFLSRYLPKYLADPNIGEIVVTDENGNDYEKIKQNFQDPKIRLYRNDVILGPLLNKLKAALLAQNEWIAIIDSDNFADEEYFRVARDYITTQRPGEASILAPSFAMPNFDYRHLEGWTLKRETLADAVRFDAGAENGRKLETLMNTGNYIVNRHLVRTLDLEPEANNIALSPSCDVIYMNTLYYEQLGLAIHVVPGLHYTHVVHPGSIYIQTHAHYGDFNRKVHERFRNLYKQA